MKQLFLTSSVSEVIDDIVKHIGNVSGLKLMFINTAAEVEGGDKQWLDNDRDALVNVGFEVRDYTLTGKSKADFEKDFKDIDVIFVSGGNTFYLLQQINESEFTKFITAWINDGKIYIGSSAGSMVVSPDIEIAIVADSIEQAPKLKSYNALGVVDFIVLPHWGSEYFRDIYLPERINKAYGMKNKIILLTDNQYVYVKGDWYRIEEINSKQ
ncbi:MAG TPA: Type 1 glutamine amidotransferase-like domain-containing protein [Candidatus Nitrosocosmicus sp.]|nr:Type 1 glutamine amidotransferase-like domain-containing protein [Candidatus Nitrosocosmicus sp.]